jgi:hypothetical protein
MDISLHMFLHMENPVWKSFTNTLVCRLQVCWMNRHFTNILLTSTNIMNFCCVYLVNPRCNGPRYNRFQILYNRQNLVVYNCEFLEMLMH